MICSILYGTGWLISSYLAFFMLIIEHDCLHVGEVFFCTSVFFHMELISLLILHNMQQAGYFRLMYYLLYWKVTFVIHSRRAMENLDRTWIAGQRWKSLVFQKSLCTYHLLLNPEPFLHLSRWCKNAKLSTVWEKKLTY